MNIELSNNIIKEIDWYNSSEKVSILQHNLVETSDNINKIVSNNIIGNYTFEFGHEVITDIDFYNYIINTIDNLSKLGNNILVSTASIKPDVFTFNPITNLYIQWKNLYQRVNISWNQSYSEIAWPLNLYNKSKLLNDIRYCRTLISVRKETDDRNLLFNKISKFDLDINRYAKYITDANHETVNDLNRVSNFPQWSELLDEYEKTYFSFIIETNHTDTNNISCQLTEKTLIPFFTGTIPIVIGQRNIIKYLTDIGFWVANNDFGFGLGDDYIANSEYKLNSYVNCVENISKLSLSECRDYWLSNKEKIQHNYDLIYSILNYGK